MELRKQYAQMISKVLAPALIGHGFSRNRDCFYYSDENNWGLIDFQISKKSDATQVNFTINVGIASGRILSFLGQERSKKKPDIWDTHWRSRIGHLTPENDDVWWKIDEETNIDNLGQALIQKIEKYALPEMRKFIGDSSLRDLWMTGKSPSLTEFQRLLYLSVLLKEIGPSELVEPTIDEIRRVSENKPTAVTAEVFIEKLRSI